MGSLNLVGRSCKSTVATESIQLSLGRHHRVMMFAIVAVLLCCTVAGSSTNTTQIVYQLQCPKPCACGPGENVTHSSGIVSINCSSRILHLPLSVQSNTAHNTTGGDNETVYIPHLDLLDLSLNNLTSVAAVDIFMTEQTSGLTPLLPVQKLNASHNAIQTLTDTQFVNYIELSLLDLSNNKIHTVSGRTFEGMESLELLDLSYNMISALSDSDTVFSSLVKLHSLDLSSNQLQVVPDLHALSSLQYLYVQHNRLHAPTVATASLLPRMPSLRYLDLSDNPLRQTQAAMFHTLPALRTLNLNKCSISHLDDKFLEGVTFLRDLRLDENNLTSIESPIFENTSLSTLSLTSMPSLASLSHNVFKGLSRLHHLNLSHNPDLTFIHPHMLSPLSQLQQLDLSHCSISLLSQMTFHFNQVLKDVYLNSNPLACSCVNAWLAQELSKTAANMSVSRFKDLDNVSCVNTSSQLVQPLVSHSFQCDEISLQNVSSSVSVPLGGQLLLRCDHNSTSTTQPGLVRWTTPGGKVFLQHNFHPQSNSHLLTPQDIEPGAEYHKGHYWRGSTTYYPHLSHREDRVIILADGSLYIDYMLRTDTGPYECQVSNAHYNKSAKVLVYLNYKLSGEIKIFAIIVGLLCALAFFTLNLIYVIISWIARRLVNKRRREIIRQMLENMNAYKSSQITRIQENYTYQLGRVRNQYHMQRDRLHKNYTQQVTKMKRGCSNSVEKVRDNYTSRLAQLRDYSSNQIVQIRERANNQIVRIRDYGTSQLEKLRETYKLQHLHVMKLLDTMNLDNCRHIVETECMRAESMMFDVDLLGDDMRTDSPMSGVDSEYTTPDTSPAPSLEVNAPQGLAEDMAQHKQPRQKILHPARDSPSILLEMQTTLTSAEGGLALDVTDQWEYSGQGDQGRVSPHNYLMNMYIPGKDKNETILQLQSELDGNSCEFKENFPLPVLFLEDEEETNDSVSVQDQAGGSPFVTPEASPMKKLKPPLEQSRDTQGHDKETDL